MAQTGDTTRGAVFGLVVLAALVPISVSAAISSENYSIESTVINYGTPEGISSGNFRIDQKLGEDLTLETLTPSPSSSSSSISPPQPPPPQPPSPSDEDGEAEEPSHVTSEDAPLPITPEQSGTLTRNLSDGKVVVVDIPRSAVSSEVVFVIRGEVVVARIAPSTAANVVSLGDAIFDITAVDANGNLVHVFPEPLTITVAIPNLPADTSDIGLYSLDEDAGVWRLVPDVSFADGKATFQVDHLTTFAVFRVPGRPLTIPFASQEAEALVPSAFVPPQPPEVTPEKELEIEEIFPPARFDIELKPGAFLRKRSNLPFVVLVLGIFVFFGFVRYRRGHMR